MRNRIPEPFVYKQTTVIPIAGWKDHGLRWFANCNAVSIVAKTKAQMRELISEQLESDRIMGSH